MKKKVGVAAVVVFVMLSGVGLAQDRGLHLGSFEKDARKAEIEAKKSEQQMRKAAEKAEREAQKELKKQEREAKKRAQQAQKEAEAKKLEQERARERVRNEAGMKAQAAEKEKIQRGKVPRGGVEMQKKGPNRVK